ncbi:serine/arginine repetitive matrix protein 1-like isoform X1 [Pteropus vampyrus]|uniref:Serine/arginine repetitive matrix protein 1-like isoform X1 n=1 Tax=Pteropus vampyrus TaxID=132908 RepID=A0A6P6BUM5_PTEVA|nr:serine/arginine repetitive matrix protein 1-like isoform X1 [Pteropus vampyrus]
MAMHVWESCAQDLLPSPRKQVVPRQNSAFSLSLARLPAVRRSPLLASSSAPAPSPAERPCPRLRLRTPGGGGPQLARPARVSGGSHLLELWWLSRRKKKKKRQGKGKQIERKRTRRERKKATSDGKLVRTGAVCKNGKVDRRWRHKSVSGPSERERRPLALPSRWRVAAWSRGSHRCEGARRRREGALRTPPPAPPPAQDFRSSHLASELPPQPQPQRGEQEQPRSSRRARPGELGFAGVCFRL